MKVPSRPNYFLTARFRRFHHGRGNQLKAGGLLVEKRELKSWLIFSACVSKPQKPVICPHLSTNEVVLAGRPVYLPRAHGWEALTEEVLLFQSPFLDSRASPPAFACIWQPHVRYLWFWFILWQSLPSWRSFQRNSGTCKFTFECYFGNYTNFSCSRGVWVWSHS